VIFLFMRDGCMETMINPENESAYGLPLFRLGFRPFFLGAGIFAIIAIAVWTGIYNYGLDPEFSGYSARIWHAHEMIFGYAMAVISGFLLTGIRNWTGLQTLRGTGLALLFALWAAARVVPLSGLHAPVTLTAALDLSFMSLLMMAAAMPVLKARQFNQIGIISKLVLLLCSNVMFYLGVFGIVEQGVQWGLYSGLYMVLALVFVMGRRVIPFFIEKGVDTPVVLVNRAWLDISSLLALLSLWVADVFTPYAMLVSLLSAVLVILHVIRMIGWYSHQIWSKPLLWVLFVAYASLVGGFALKAAQCCFDISPLLAVHAFAYGGIGVITLGMMSRVILGHTGRNVFEPPAVLFWCFALLVAGAIVRVLLPLLALNLYSTWIEISQLLWILAFTVFLFVFAPMLLSPRVDGRDG
jgi:uncharacterized protein involved in response to NO